MAFTYFFRDLHTLELIAHHLVPYVAGRSKIRIWDAGCAMGQEPYSLAIILAEKMGHFAYRNLLIQATDIDGSNRFADIITKGEYPEEELQRIPRDYYAKYFHQSSQKGFSQLAEVIRKRLVFQKHEMIESSIKKTEAGTRIAENTSGALREIVSGATKVTDLIGEIAAASKEQAQGIGQIGKGLNQVDQVTQQNTAIAEESASASEELSSQSLQLKQMLAKFALKQLGYGFAGPGMVGGFNSPMSKLATQRHQRGFPEVKAPKGLNEIAYAGKEVAVATNPGEVISLDDQEFGNF